MAFSVKTGTFDTITTTGSQAVTGVGFQPKVILIFGRNTISTEGNVVNSLIGLGVGTSSTSRFAGNSYAADAVVGGVIDVRNFKATKILSYSLNGTTTDFEGDLTSLDADGFTINWGTMPASGRLLGYIALGGSDLSAKVGTFNLNTITGNQAVTGAGFQPDVVLFYDVIGNTTDGPATTEFSMLGFGVSSSSRFVTQIAGTPTTTPSSENSIQLSTKCIHREMVAGVSQSADFVSLDSDGFTTNITTTNGTAVKIGYLALKGVNVFLNTETQKTSTGTKATTGVGFTPSIVLFASRGKAAGTTLTANASQTLGAAVSTSNRIATAGSANDAKSTTEADRRLVSTACITYLTAGTPTVNAEADLSSMDSDGYTLNWTTADATARETIFLALGQVSSTLDKTYKGLATAFVKTVKGLAIASRKTKKGLA